MNAASPTLPATLDEWLQWQQRLNPQEMVLGLERVIAVLSRLGLDSQRFPVITVAGTNGKGSTVAFLTTMLASAGYRVGSYTSPHLQRYNERIQIAGRPVSDVQLCDAFRRVELARQDIPLTFFEYGTLAALVLFRELRIQVAVLEVGLGGRLDAVNAVEPQATVVTTVDLDHQEWLGEDREQIGFEKAGIFRANCPAVYGDLDPPQSVVERATALGSPLYRWGVDFDYRRTPQGWEWHGPGSTLTDIPLPGLAGEHQLRNAASAVMALTTIRDRLPLNDGALRVAVATTYLAGRFQVIPGPVECILDVTHNPQGIAALADCLAARPPGGVTRAVVAMLQDKDPDGLQALAHQVTTWYTAGIGGPRGRSGANLAERVAAWATVPVHSHEGVAAACRQALSDANPGDRLLIFGSFYTVSAALEADLEALMRG